MPPTIASLQARVPVAGVDVDRTHFDAVQAEVLDEL
jgi:hypothetical protein